MSIKVNIKVDFKELKAVERNVKRAMMRGVERGSEYFMEHARDDHDQDAHSKGRFQTRSGQLISGIRVMPVMEEGDALVGGVISYKDYSAPVEEGHDIKRGGKVLGHAQAYPFMMPAIEDKETQQKFLDELVREVKKAL